MFHALSRFTLSCSAVLLSAFATHAGNWPFERGYETYAEEHAFAADVLTDLNRHSIFVDLEFCGFIYREDGVLHATRSAKGDAASCRPIAPDGDVAIFASYHTHAAFDPASFNEYPSIQGMEGDFGRFENGYISTPGGRLWFVNNQKRRARQLCGYRCLPFDPHYSEASKDAAPYLVTIEDLTGIFARGTE